MASSVKSQRL